MKMRKMVMMKKRAKICFNLFKESMGSKWRAYRPQYDWFKIEDIVNDTDQNWKELVEINPSLQYAVYEFSRVFFEKKMGEFRERYQLPNEVIKEFFNIYVGYHPSFGLYLCSIGPYKGKKAEDEQNKFGYFTHRLASTDSYNLRTFLTSFINDSKSNFPALSESVGKNPKSGKEKIMEGGKWNGEWIKGGLWDILDESDFIINIQHRTGERRGQKQWASMNYETLNLTPEFMEQNDIQLAQEKGNPVPYSTVIGVGSWIQLKPSGARKLLEAVVERNGHTNEINEIIGETAQRRGIPMDQVFKAFDTDSGFAKEVIDMYSTINPVMDGIFSPRRMGAQQPDALTTPKQMIRNMALKQELIETAIALNTEDPTAIASAMNTKRSAKGMAKGQLTPQIIQYMMLDLDVYRQVTNENGEIVGRKTFADILTPFKADFDQAQGERGFNDIESALRMASLYVAGAVEKVDPVTKAKLIEVPNIFGMTEGIRNYTSDELMGLRDGTLSSEDLKEGFITQDTELQEVEDIEELPSEGEIDHIKVDKPLVRTPRQPKEQIDEDEEAIREEKENEMIATTLKALKKIAYDLRNQGNGKTAWGIEKVIRKYQRRI